MTDAIFEELRSQRNLVFDQFGNIIANLKGELAIANARIQELEAEKKGAESTAP